MSAPRPTPTRRLRTALPPLVVLAVAVGYLGLALWSEELPAPRPGDVPPLVHAGLVALQAAALVLRRRSPLPVLAVVVLLDLVVLATTAGELGIGAIAVVLASFAVARRLPRTAALTALGAGAAATTLVGGTALLAGSSESLPVLLALIAARVVLLYAAPAAVADVLRGRERLAAALREQERMAEGERRERAEREIRADRAALARELHDIAGHHLSGIIVGTQAATALLTRDPEGARELLRTVQDDARITLTDLRRAVGLLRADDEPLPSGSPAPAPTVAGIAGLVEAARTRGQRIESTTAGEPRPLGPLAETAAYRMVQESLANAARHARGARAEVWIVFGPEAAEVVVWNEAPLERTAPATASPGFGLAGMAERAELIGARLTTGPTTDGGWRNRLVVPLDGRSSP